MRLRVLVLATGVSVVTAASDGAATSAAQRSVSLPILSCAGVSVRVPPGWHGRVRTGNGGVFTLTLATFPLVAEADDVDEQSAKRMSRGDVLVLLIGYGRDQVRNPAFQTHLRLPLTVQKMTIHIQFEHLPLGHRLARTMFLARSAAYDAQVEFAAPLTPVLRRKANSTLGLLRFGPPPRQAPSRRTRC